MVAAVIADRAHVDLRRQPEIEDLGDHVGGLEIEVASGNAAGSTSRSLRDVVGGRRVALLRATQDHAVVDADGRAVGEGQIIRARRQADIVDDELAFVLRNDLADLVLDRLENAFGGLDAGAGGRADMKLDLAAVDGGKKSRPTSINSTPPSASIETARPER